MATSPASISPPGSAPLCKLCGNAVDLGVNFCPVCGTPTRGDGASDPLVGRVVADRYRIVQLLGRGGMGVVYKCEHTRMGKVMAIKLLHGELAGDQEVQRRFRREALAASKLSHASTVSIFDFGTSDGLTYLVMEFVQGDDLGKVLRTETRLPATRVAAIAAQACGSLAEAHDKGIVHRDLKPENLLVSRLKDGRDLVKLLDFGLAKVREGEERNEITSAGTLVGTPYYMAPEVIRGQGADGRTDIYALGAVIYRAVTGTPAYTGSSPVAVLTKHLTDELVLPSKRRPDYAVPAAIDAIVERCMKKDPAERYAHIEELREALVEYLAQEGLADSLLRDSGVTSKLSAASERAKPRTASGAHAVATRGDVEAFERKLQRGRRMGWGAAAAAVLVGAGGAGLLWHAHAAADGRPHDAEVEPNNTAGEATLIAPGTEVHGQLGQRIASDRGDVDLYRLQPLPAGPWRLHAELSGVPGVDVVLELLESERASAVAVADTTEEGGREVLSGFRVLDGTYYLSVHERLRPGAVPHESISDGYALRYTLAPLSAGLETEPDDNEEVAAALPAGGEVRGYLDGRDDVDYWCLDAQPGALRLTLAPPEGVDLALVVHPRDGGAEAVTDDARSGAAETASVPAAQGRGACVIVRGSDARGALERGDPEHAYTLRVERL